MEAKNNKNKHNLKEYMDQSIRVTSCYSCKEEENDIHLLSKVVNDVFTRHKSHQETHFIENLVYY